MLSQFKRQLYDHIGLLIDSSDTNDLISYDIYKKERTLLGENGNCVKMRIIFITKPRTANCKAPFSIEFQNGTNISPYNFISKFDIFFRKGVRSRREQKVGRSVLDQGNIRHRVKGRRTIVRGHKQSAAHQVIVHTQNQFE